ncbi:MAG: hypothetical protein QM765_36370 [Myxococcales bacterium]
MQLRYRILTGQVDQRQYRRVLADIQRRSMGFAFAAGAETPRRVLASDGEGEVEEVSAMIADGRMAPHDLVDWGEGWRDAREFPPLADVCAEIDRKERRAQWAETGRQVLVSVLIALAVLVLYRLTH